MSNFYLNKYIHLDERRRQITYGATVVVAVSILVLDMCRLIDLFTDISHATGDGG